MSELFDDDDDEPAPLGANAPEFTVSEISGAVKRVIEGEFGLVRVRGEISRVSRPASGHFYFDLKDDRASIAAIIWKGQASKLKLRPEEGIEVVATGRLTTFPGQSKYQMIIDDIAPAGIGALMVMLEKRKAALMAEGLFDEANKKPIPYLPHTIGVITSPSGAVIRDILHRLRDRFPRHVLIWPVAVQGDRCAPEVAAAIRGFNALTPTSKMPRPDLIIVARGGGSIEDLWGFNEEIVVRAAAASTIPLISAVGHETDTTLIDYASDRRAPTPTAAAEMAVPVRSELLAWVDAQQARLSRSASQALTQRSQRLRDIARALPRPATLLAQAQQRFDQWADRLPGALRAATSAKRARYNSTAALMRPDILTRFIAQERRYLADHFQRLRPGLLRALSDQSRKYLAAQSRLRPDLLAREVQAHRRALTALDQRLTTIAATQLNRWSTKLLALDRLHQTLGYQQTLKRGYAVVWGDGAVMASKAQAEGALALEIQFHDGNLAVAASDSGPAAPTPRPVKKLKPAPEQGDLF